MITRLVPTNQVQFAILTALATDQQLVGLIPADRIYAPQPPNKPERPFVLYGSPITTPRKVQGGDCADVSGAIHCFVDKTNDILDPHAFANDIAAHITRILDGMDELDLGDGMTVNVYPLQAQVMQDGSPSSWHSFVTFRAEAS